MGRKLNTMETTQTTWGQLSKRGRPHKNRKRNGKKVETKKYSRHNITHLWTLEQIKRLIPGRVILDGSFARIMEEKRENPMIRPGLPTFIKHHADTNEYVFKKEVLSYDRKGVLYVRIMVDTEYKVINLNVVDRFNSTYPAYWNRGWGENDIVKEADLIINEILNDMVHFCIIALPKD